jgi:arylsulfatase
MRRSVLSLFTAAVVTLLSVSAYAQSTKPNIVVFWGDDIGQSNISAFSHGVMGYPTPNIDRIAKEGMMLKPLSYATGQFGKNHLGDRSEFLPTVLGFDEFYGNLYHLNAEEERELPGDAMDCKASNTDDATVDPRFGRVGRQVCKDTGPLTKKRMETVDDDIVDRAVDFMTRRGYEQVGVIKRPVVVGVRHLPREVGFPQRRKAASFNLDDVMKKMSESSGSK